MLTALLKSLTIKLIKARWGAILPAIFKAAAEGDFGPQVKAAYWALAGKKTIIGASILGAGVALETLCASYPQWGWPCGWSRWVYLAGGILTSVGLADGGTRAPWPAGTPKDPAVLEAAKP